MSAAGDILDAAEAVVTGLGLAPTPTIRRRKRPVWLDGDGPGPLVILAVGDGETAQQVSTRAGKRRFLVGYPLAVAIGFRSAGKAADNPTLRAWREAVRGALLDWYSGLRAEGLAEVQTVRPGSARPVFDPQGFAAQGVDWGDEVFTVEVAETAS